jgi:hypothetical protein
MKTIRFLHAEIEICSECGERFILIAEIHDEKIVATFKAELPVVDRHLNREEYLYHLPSIN